MSRVKFISYDGKYPNLCSGKLVLQIDDIIISDLSLSSGGSVSFDSDWKENVESGSWRVNNFDNIPITKDDNNLQEEICDYFNKKKRLSEKNKRFSDGLNESDNQF